MAPRSTTTTRKRARPSTEQDAPTMAKKRRVKASGETPVDGNANDGVNGQNKEPTKAANGTSRRSGRSTKAAPTAPAAPPSDGKQPKTASRRTTAAGKAKSAGASQKDSVYDVPDSGEDEQGTATGAPRRKLQKKDAAPVAKPVESEIVSAPVVAPASGEQQPVILKRKRGRPSKQDREARAALERQGLIAPAAPKRGAAQAKQPVVSGDDEGCVNGVDTQTTTTQPRQPQKRDRAKKLMSDAAVLPKGILTPRKEKGKRGLGRPPKSVAFDGLIDEKVLDGLAATSLSKSAKKRREAAEAVEEMQVAGGEEDEDGDEEEEDEEDEEVCAICSKPDSKPPNEIVFCDNCDTPVHQQCYGLAEVPEGDWICRSCSQEDATATAATVSTAGAVDGMVNGISSVVARGGEALKPDIPNFDLHLRSAQRVLLDRCAGRRRIKLWGQAEAYDKAYQLVKQTVVAGEGNSMMIIGARGCGKTTLVESIITDLSKQHEQQFHVVRLSGFIHTDDKLALKEIWRQLGKEMEVEDELVNKASQTTNHADTMASLLALLSHPSEIAETQDGVTSRSIVFVIDEFDLFATHARQTLLYNLFDIAQARKAPIAVLGLTTRIDVVESLEKRVKSRFSHRYVYLSLPKSLPAFWDVCKQGLSVDDEDMVAEGIDEALEGHVAFWGWWNGKIDRFTKHLESHFFATKSVSAFLTTCLLPLASLSPTNLGLTIPAGHVSVSVEPPDSKLHLLPSLSDLDLSLLIAAARLDIVAHTDTVNFAMAYDEYTALMGRQRVQSASSGMLALGGGARVWGRGTAGIAWERLVALGLLVPAAAGGRGTAGLGGLDAKMWKVDIALEEMPGAVKLNAVLARWCREI
ncbi:origin recognition complex subunit 4 C-terminus-domain-containing protein [Dichotomopilus funicola]|uniref:Origin recognition complex subunit 4 n=1 Tax=Dichotomopilus funicola TaxID=1934379 RepID=A0AAN6V8J2_9PEZI|nr:origin recognition complex subunit 4 C-terminus-domain-containing protein [Dichotomopilus funicola]